MRPQDVPVLPGFYTTSDVRRLCAFQSRQSSVNLILSGVLPPSAVYKIGAGASFTYLVDAAVFDRYLTARAALLQQRHRAAQARRLYQQLRGEVRAWAGANGVPFPRRGLMPRTLLDQYRLAQMGDQPGAA